MPEKETPKFLNFRSNKYSFNIRCCCFMLLLKGEGGYRGPFLEITGKFSGRNQLLELFRLFPHSCKQRHQLKLGVTKSVALQLFKTSYLTGPYVSLLFFFVRARFHC